MAPRQTCSIRQKAVRLQLAVTLQWKFAISRCRQRRILAEITEQHAGCMIHERRASMSWLQQGGKAYDGRIS
jgi:hypothetical protein